MRFRVGGRTRVAACGIGIAALLASSAGAGEDLDALKAARERVRREAVVKAGEVDVTRADITQLDQALQALNTQLAAQEQLLEDADEGLDAARAHLADVEERLADLEQRFERLTDQVRRIAVDAYLDGPDASDLVLNIPDVAAWQRRNTLREVRTGDAAQVLVDYRTTGMDLADTRSDAETARRSAKERHDEVAARTDELRDTRSKHALMQQALEDRLEAVLAEGAVLASQDASLAQRISSEQARVEDLLRRAAAARARKAAEAKQAADFSAAVVKRQAADKESLAAAAKQAASISALEQAMFQQLSAKREAELIAQADKARRAALQARDSATPRATPKGSTGATGAGGAGSGAGGGGADSGADGAGGAGTGAGGTGADGAEVADAAPVIDTSGLPTIADTKSVYGIRVHVSIADRVQALLEAAADDGLVLGGWGYRDTNKQIELRRAHCGSTTYAIYQMPSSQCVPPTARPGRSMHERGKAIDFTCGGGPISSHRNKCWIWLAEHAADYGLFNLASEPWHWSTTGD